MKVDFDPRIQVGSFVTGYHKGVWKVTRIEEQFITQYDLRTHYYKNEQVGDLKNIIIYYEKVMGDDFHYPHARLRKCCGAPYCKLVDAKFLQDIKDECNRQVFNLTNLLNGNMDNWKERP